ncbi:isoprenylcysteine carboxyl methyltransferase family protein [Bacillus sp. AK128]
MVFYLLIGFIILQRFAELIIAKQNEKWMKGKGAIEVGKEHYRFMILLHSSFFLVLLIEFTWLNKDLSPLWPVLITFFCLTQLLRVWALTSLGKYWNTKIIVLPNTEIVKKGPYKWIRHPNYLIVMLEIILIPLLFQAYWTAVIFTVLNLWILSIRIPLEEKALLSQTDYNHKFQKVSRFSPIRLK